MPTYSEEEVAKTSGLDSWSGKTSPELSVPTKEKTVTFGIVDGNNEAHLIFSDGDENNRTFTELFVANTRGFSDEVLKLSCYVDIDMVFRAKVCTNRTPSDSFRAWTYSNLKVSYELDAPAPDYEE